MNISIESSRPNQPAITTESSREDLIAWLVWNDANGTWTDADSAGEGLDPLDRDDALEAVREHI